MAGVPKTDTALLYEVPLGRPRHWRFDCWGKEATDKYIGMADPDRFRLIKGKQFKLALSDDRAGLPQEFQLPRDCPFTPDQLITQMLSCLRDHAISYLQRAAGLQLATTDVHYCLSVPAGWSDAAKDVIRRCAYSAGMTLRAPALAASSSMSSGSSLSSATGFDSLRRLSGRDQWDSSSEVWLDSYAEDAGGAVVLVHEQEAAALTACCDPLKALPCLRAIPGDVWVVLDAGGGTVDIAMHRIEQGATPGQSHLSEVLRALCLLNGSTMLDNMAEEALFKPLFGDRPDEYYRWRSEQRQDYLDLMDAWEIVKLRFDGSTSCSISLNFSLINALQQVVPPVTIPSRGRLILDAQQMRQLVFDPVVDPIVGNLHGLLSQERASDGRNGAAVLVMAGGFGSNMYLRERVMQVCGYLLEERPVTPGDANKAVVLGNTIHLQRPDTISARCSRYTYGVNAMRPATAECHQRGHVCKDAKGNLLCSDHFRPLVRVGDVVRVDEFSGPLNVFPAPGNNTASVDIWVTPHRDASHITEPKMRMLGTVRIDVRKAARKKWGLSIGKQSSKDYKISLYFKFGAGDLQVRAVDVTNDTVVSTTVSFSSDAAAGGPVLLPALQP
ncbi:hypothetical protein COO60DRAFT_227757 [Scenedesmus sp. NREL 46B-D3]|nr:hypothetical protein COO60DRAFT_227757 [Scenedesmus sp. NREL 46B-D3]